MKKIVEIHLDFEIEQLTYSINNANSGKVFDTRDTPTGFLDKYCPEQFSKVGLDLFTEGNQTSTKRMRIKNSEVYARILIIHRK